MLQEFRSLDGLRGWAAVSVVLYHGMLNYDPALVTKVMDPPSYLLHPSQLIEKFSLTLFNGEAAVIIFFVLSGFVLQKSLQKHPRLVRQQAVNFTLRRIFRLMPAVIASVVAVFLLKYSLATSERIPPPDFSLLFENITMINTTLHGVTWTLQVELLAVPIIFVISALARKFGFLAIALSVIYAIAATQNPALTFGLPNLHLGLLPFALGMLMATPECKILFAGSHRGSGVACLGMYLFARFFVYHGQITAGLAQNMMAALLIGILAYSERDWFSQFLSSPISQFLGRISFSLYLFAPVVGSAIVFALSSLIGIEPRFAVPAGILVGSVIAVATIPIAVLAERFVERPGIRFGQLLLLRLDSQTSQRSPMVSIQLLRSADVQTESSPAAT